jgi:hypothetical protein
LNEFLGWARRFADSVRMIARYPSPGPISSDDLGRIEDAERSLRVLAAHANRLFGTAQGGALSCSLLSCYAWMALWDAANEWLNVCDKCGRVFVSTAGRARYCSGRCRKTCLQREWRQRRSQKEKKRQAFA